ncbi:tetratricopeptide repeat protein [Chitinophaga sp. XS-30]|uniref:tetratricopeptide repeat protein n=1 Tax=Chitinophaga sp. XS-30 TaxID=2604421 RepID=UPI0011DD545B|nr:tetratricopeptide repeat protein [Chitinophaga sp. XS-30]QEH41296.1 tetratricopeptide repeat protein [Chitinophaga sp. XS-30]
MKLFTRKNFSLPPMHVLLLLAGLTGATAAEAQQTRVYTEPDKVFKEAQQLYREGKYAVSMQLFRQTIDDIGYFQETNRSLVNTDAHYYYTMCALKLQNADAEKKALEFIKSHNNSAREQLVSFQLARFYFHRNKLSEAIPYYEAASIDNLSNEEIADMKFELAYCYFNVKDFAKAQPLFASIKDIENKYYIPANYYYGFISYYNKQYSAALSSFQRVQKEPKYSTVVPYYIAEIYYFQGKQDQLIAYAEPLIRQGNMYYEGELKQLVGQAYFERKDYPKALPYLEEYHENAEEVRKEDVYQLSYTYYQTANLDKAIAGFKQLSSEKDSLGQNSMYLLGDCYLRTGQKANARNAFAFSARNSSNPKQQEISRFNYGKLSFELGYQDVAISELRGFLDTYPRSEYIKEAREILVQLFANTNNYKEAMALLNMLPEKSPAVLKAYQKVAYGRATQLINDQQLAEADRLLDISLTNPYDSRIVQLAQFWKAEIALRQNNPDKAIGSLQAYFNSGATPISGEANTQTASYNMGYSLLKKEQYTAALPYFEAAQRTSGPNAGRIANDALLRMADCYYMLRDFPKALSLYDRIISANEPGADYATYQKSIIYGIQGKHNEKLSLLKQLAQQYPNSNFNNDADMEIAETYLSDERFSEAIPYLKNVLQKQPNGANAPKALLTLGLAYFNTNQGSTAMQYFRQVVEKFPNSAEANDALQSIRTIYVDQGKTDEYVALLKAAGKTVTASAEDSISYSAAETRFSNGDCAGAVTAFDSYLQRFPEGQFALQANFYKGECLFNSKDYANALPAYEAVLSRGASPFAERAALQAAYMNYYQVKDYAKARGYYQQLQSLSTTKENTLNATRGLLRSSYQLKNWEEVRLQAETLLSGNNISTDDQIVGHFYLGKAQQEKQQYDEAIAEYKIVTGLTKSEIGAEARYNIAKAYLDKNDLAAAEKAGFDVIKNTSSYELWTAKAYILLGDVYHRQKDYFNAKATFQSIAENCPIPELKAEAKTKLEQVEAEEKAGSKIK